MGQKKAKTIADLYDFMQKNMATKQELAGLKKDMTATKTQFDIVARNMATKEDIGVMKKDMATKDDITVLSGRIGVIESNYVREKDFAKFRDKTLTRLDDIKTVVDKLDIENKAGNKGLVRVSDNIEKHNIRITANRRDIDQIKPHFKMA